MALESHSDMWRCSSLQRHSRHLHLAKNILVEAKTAGLKCNYRGPSPNLNQTKQGFALYVEDSPSHIATPFGEIQLYKGDSDDDHSKFFLSEILIKRLNAVFIDKILAPELSFRCTHNQNPKIIHKYHITMLNERKIPELISYVSNQSFRSKKSITTIWEMLEANRLGQDPTLKKDQIDEVKTSIPPKLPLFESITEFSPWAIKVMETLNQQPISLVTTWLNRENKLSYYRWKIQILLIN